MVVIYYYLEKKKKINKALILLHKYLGTTQTFPQKGHLQQNHNLFIISFFFFILPPPHPLPKT